MYNRPPQFLTDQQRLARAGKINLHPPCPAVVSDKTRLVQVGRRMGPVVPVTNFPRKTHFVVEVESQVRHNVAELVFYEQCIRQTVAYKEKDGYSNSPDQDLHIRRPDVTTWNPGEVFAPAIAPLLSFPHNLWDEFVDGTGPQNSAFLSDHAVTNDLKAAMWDDVEKLLFLLYAKYNGYPSTGARYVDMTLSFGPLDALSALRNLNKTFVGSANMSGFVSGNRVVIVVADVKSAHSLAAHISHKVDHFRSSRLPMYGFTYQFYIWSVGMKDYAWYKTRKKIVDSKGRKKDWFGINPSILQ